MNGVAGNTVSTLEPVLVRRGEYARGIMRKKFNGNASDQEAHVHMHFACMVYACKALPR